MLIWENACPSPVWEHPKLNLYFKVLIPSKKEGSSDILKILCPNQFRNETLPLNPIQQENWKNKLRTANPYKISISRDGIVYPKIQYKDLCFELNYVRFAYNVEPDTFELQNKTGFTDFVRFPVSILTGWSLICWDYEILDPFFERFNIIPIYSDMNYTWGWYENETGLWTGGTGAVWISVFADWDSRKALCVCVFLMSVSSSQEPPSCLHFGNVQVLRYHFLGPFDPLLHTYFSISNSRKYESLTDIQTVRFYINKFLCCQVQGLVWLKTSQPTKTSDSNMSLEWKWCFRIGQRLRCQKLNSPMSIV